MKIKQKSTDDKKAIKVISEVVSKKRLTVDISETAHQKLKIKAVTSNKTMNELVEELVNNYL
ncbi:hypothetical protein AB4427_17825 [Vibrio artabrorum]|uniref:hypothetical protein n=1 Tax=Vibrio artabrorum TaxID=446374 RepID=UPI00354ECB52